MANPVWNPQAWALDTASFPLGGPSSPAVVALNSNQVFMAWQNPTSNTMAYSIYSLTNNTWLAGNNNLGVGGTLCWNMSGGNFHPANSPAATTYTQNGTTYVFLAWTPLDAPNTIRYAFGFGVANPATVVDWTGQVTAVSGGTAFSTASGCAPSVTSGSDAKGNPVIYMAWISNTHQSGTNNTIQFSSCTITPPTPATSTTPFSPPIATWSAAQTAASGGTNFQSPSAPISGSNSLGVSIASLPSSSGLGTLMMAWVDPTNPNNAPNLNCISSSIFTSNPPGSASGTWATPDQTHFNVWNNCAPSLAVGDLTPGSTPGNSHPVIALTDSNQNIWTSMYVPLKAGTHGPGKSAHYGWLPLRQAQSGAVENAGNIGSGLSPAIAAVNSATAPLFLAVQQTWQSVVVQQRSPPLFGQILFSLGGEYASHPITISIPFNATSDLVRFTYLSATNGWVGDSTNADSKVQLGNATFLIYQLDRHSINAGWTMTGFNQNPPATGGPCVSPLRAVRGPGNLSYTVFDPAAASGTGTGSGIGSYSFYFTYTCSSSGGVVTNVIHNDPSVGNEA